MKRSLALLVVAVIAILGIAIWMQRDPAATAASTVTGQELEERKPDSAQVQVPLIEPAASLESERAEAEVSASTKSAPADVKAADDGLAELRGRFVLPGGAPAVGVNLKMGGWPGNDQLVMKYGAPEHWENPKGVTDADGRFSFRFDPPRAYQFTLDADLHGFANVCWRWSSLPQREVTDVGEIVLARGGSIHGKIVDSTGAPLSGRWMIYADSAFQPQGVGGDQTRKHAPADSSSGEFLLEGLPPGPAQLKAHSQIANWIDGPSVIVASGEITEANIVYSGPDNSRRIVVVPSCRPFHVFNNPAEGSIKLTGPGGERTAKKIAGSSQSWSFDDLEPGSYAVEVRDPRFLPWSRSGLTPGESVRAQLQGSAAFTLTVFDLNGAPVEDYRLRLEFQNINSWPREFELRGKEAPLPPGGTYAGIIPSDFTLRIDAADYSTCEVPVEGLAPQETRAIVAQLTRGSTLRGVVLDGATRAPVANARVELGPYFAEPTDPADIQARAGVMQFRINAREKISESLTDAQGRFEYASVAPASYELSARLNAHIHATISPLVINAAGERSVEIVLPASGSIVGRLIGPEGASFEGLAVDATPPKLKDDPFAGINRFGSQGIPSTGSLARDGSYELGPLPVGPVEVELVFPGGMVPTSFNSSMGVNGPRQVLGTVEIEAGRKLTRDFDLRESFPARLRVNVRLAAAPGASLVVMAQRSLSDQTTQPEQSASQTDASGSAVLGPMMPGEWSVTVRPVDSSWTWTSTAPVHVTSNTEAVLDVVVVLVEGTIQVFAEDDGKPLANRRVLVINSNDAFHSVESDSEGRVRLISPVGMIGIADGGDPDSFPRWDRASVQVDWTATGPVPDSVRVKRAPEAQKLPGRGN